MITVLQLFKSYKGNIPLHNEMARLDPGRFRTIACYLDGKDDGRNGMEEVATRAIYLGCPSARQRWYNVRLLRDLRDLIEGEGVHIVNCQLHRTTPLGIVAAKLSKNRPVVLSTIHGLGGTSGWNRRLQNRLMFPNLERLVAISHAVRDDILAGNRWLHQEKIVTVQNGLTFGPFLTEQDKSRLRRELFPDIQNRFWFGTAGRLTAVKNHETLIKAFQEVSLQQPDCVLLIMGRGELEASLKKLVSTLGLTDKVRFLGFRADVAQVLKSLDCFVLPSLREGFGLALLEAMASGLPVVASRVGGIPEVFSADPMGTLVEPSDISGLVAAMVKMTEESPEQLRQMGENARRRALGQFQAERMTSEYAALYEECYRSWLQQHDA